MTAATTTRSAYPRAVDDLIPHARALAADLGTVPSRNLLKKTFKIGPDKAKLLLAELIAAPTVPPAMPTDPEMVADVERSGPIEDTGTDIQVRAVPEPGPEQVKAPVTVAASNDRTADDSAVTQVDVEPAAPHYTSAPERGATNTQTHDGPAVPPVDNTSAVRDPGRAGRRSAGAPVGVEIAQFKRRRWAVRAVLALGVAASIAGNVLHAEHNIISQVISAWSPTALLLTVELVSRVPVYTRHLATARLLATGLIAVIAAWVSYWHMAAVASRYGESGSAAYLLPLSVDGLVIVASVCLVELGGRINASRS